MKQIVLSIIFLLSGISSMLAQTTLPAKCEIFYPEVLLSSVVLPESKAIALENSSDYGQRKAPRNKTFWVVYSDRDDNQTYDAPGGGKKYSSLSLNDRVRIAQIKNGYALVYTEPQVDIAFPMISQNAECKGWIPMKNLLLWHSCPANEAGIYNKALLCVNLDNVGSEIGRLFKSPDNMNNFESLTTDNQFYFIMKHERNLVLLARYHTTDGRTDQVLLGWVANESYVPWNQRSCIEPTWDRRDVEYFLAENIEVYVYPNKILDKPEARIPYQIVENSSSRDPYLYRMSGDELRYPILDASTEELYNCSTFSGTHQREIIDINQKSALGYKEEVLREKENINIGIVIDGTSSMESFYPAVKEAIKEGVKFFDSKKFKIKVGVVIYRDYSDGEYITETLPLTSPANPKLEAFLDTGGKYGVKSAKSDKTLEEAMYNGIDVALEQLGFNKKHNNIMLVIGDCGNDRSDDKITVDMIVDKLVEKDVNIMSFQVRRGDEDAFSLFNAQLQTILVKSLKKKYSQIEYLGRVEMKETEDGYSMVNDVNSNLYVGSHNMPVAGQSQMKIERLSKLMQEAIMYCAQSVDYQIKLIETGPRGFRRNDNVVDTRAKVNDGFLRKTLGDAYDAIVSSGSMMSFKGYSPKYHKSGRSYFKPVVFISSDELNALIDRLAPVNDAAVMQTNDRAPYVNAMKALAQSMVGDITDAEMSQMGVQEIMNMVSGLNEATGALKGYTISEIASTQAVSEVKYLSLVNDFKRKFRTLQRIKGTPYKYTRTVNGLKYYWLPVEDLP